MEEINILETINSYIDKIYLLTLVLMGNLVNAKFFRERLVRTTNLRAKSYVRTSILGAIWGVIVYVIRDYDKHNIESLFFSYLIGITFYEGLIERWIKPVFNKKECENGT